MNTNLIKIAPLLLEPAQDHKSLPRQPSLFEGQRMGFRDAIDLSLQSLIYYGNQYNHWCIAYSGGKDSSATVSFVVWAIKNKLVPPPEKLYVLYADTGMELSPLWATAERFMADLRNMGIEAWMVKPTLDDQFYVYMLGRGVTPPSNRFRWCTQQLKVEPMEAALSDVYSSTGEKFLQITGVRQGESAARDERIAVSCSTKDGECGQGWFQARPSTHVADTLAPIVHWRQCFVWDWLYFANSDQYVQRVLDFKVLKGHGFDYLADIAVAYGDDAARTGCIGCNLVSKDIALENIVRNPDWAHLAPLMEIKPLYNELKMAKHRLRKASPQLLKDGKTLPKNAQRLGPLTMPARSYGLERILDIQKRAGVTLIDKASEARIRELWTLDTWPDGWEGGSSNPNHVVGSEALDRIIVSNGEALITKRLV